MIIKFYGLVHWRHFKLSSSIFRDMYNYESRTVQSYFVRFSYIKDIWKWRYPYHKVTNKALHDWDGVILSIIGKIRFCNIKILPTPKEFPHMKIWYCRPIYNRYFWEFLEEEDFHQNYVFYTPFQRSFWSLPNKVSHSTSSLFN